MFGSRSFDNGDWLLVVAFVGGAIYFLVQVIGWDFVTTIF